MLCVLSFHGFGFAETFYIGTTAGDNFKQPLQVMYSIPYLLSM